MVVNPTTDSGPSNFNPLARAYLSGTIQQVSLSLINSRFPLARFSGLCALLS